MQDPFQVITLIDFLMRYILGAILFVFTSFGWLSGKIKDICLKKDAANNANSDELKIRGDALTGCNCRRVLVEAQIYWRYSVSITARALPRPSWQRGSIAQRKPHLTIQISSNGLPIFKEPRYNIHREKCDFLCEDPRIRYLWEIKVRKCAFQPIVSRHAKTSRFPSTWAS